MTGLSYCLFMIMRTNRRLLWLSVMGNALVSVTFACLAARAMQREGLTILTSLLIASCILSAIVAIARGSWLRSHASRIDRVHE